MPKALMLQGTGSDVGKSFLTAGLCRALTRRGLQVAPFKPQNMSNNAAVVSAACGEGEIGRAQWLQALAARRTPNVDMNPVLLKPQSDRASQIIVQGRVFETTSARAYQDRKETLLPFVLESFERLSRQADLILVEGAGSPAEVNLRAGDIANMGFARATGTPVILVGDIDRGGVIAALVGTRAVLDPKDADLIKGFIINRFRGDISLFDDALALITNKTGWRSFGVVPWLEQARELPAEDAVVLEREREVSRTRELVISAPVLSRVANFDDLDPLQAEPAVEVRFVPPGRPIPRSDLIVLLGTKSTLAELAFLRTQGWDIDIKAHVRQGGRVLGLCGGLQMLGSRVRDPQGLEGPAGAAEALGLLEIETVIAPQKQVRTVTGYWAKNRTPVAGYEIHMGQTEGPDLSRPMLRLAHEDHGAVSANGRIMGCYLHGLFSSDAFRAAFLEDLGIPSQERDYWKGVDESLDIVASRLEGCVDIDGLLAVAGL